MRRLLLVVTLIATALTLSVLPTSFATMHGPHFSRHRASVGIPKPGDVPVVVRAPDSVEQPPEDLLIGKRLVIDAVTFRVEAVRTVVVTRAPPTGRHLASVERAELQVWRV